MIALIAGGEEMRQGPIPVALAYAGFTTRAAFTTDAAGERLSRHGAGQCVLVIDAGSLEWHRDGASWRSFLARHRTLAAVVIARAEEPGGAGGVASGPHRVLVQVPFDLPAVVAAARRASSASRAPMRFVPDPVHAAPRAG